MHCHIVANAQTRYPTVGRAVTWTLDRKKNVKKFDENNKPFSCHLLEYIIVYLLFDRKSVPVILCQRHAHQIVFKSQINPGLRFKTVHIMIITSNC